MNEKEVAALRRRLEAEGVFDKSRVGSYSIKTSNSERDELGNIQTTSVSASIKPVADWKYIERPARAAIKAVKVKKVKRPFKVAVFLPDPQIGFRWYGGNDWQPFHDERAIDLSMQLIREIQPDEVVNLGDMIDFPTLSRWPQEEAMQRTIQKSIDYTHEFLSLQRANAPHAKLVWVEGNHDLRLQNYVQANAAKISGLRRANMDHELPLLSIPYLLRLDEIGVNYVGGWPKAEYYLSDVLKAKHGDCVKSSGKTAAAVVEREDVSTVFGHIHRAETAYKTRHGRKGPRTQFAHCPGALCLTNGAVPGFHTGTDTDMKPVTYWQDWQLGLTVVHYDDEQVYLHHVPFGNDYQALYEGKVYQA